MGNCKKCNRPRQGHVGPLGSRCAQTPWVKQQQDEVGSTDSDGEDPGPIFTFPETKSTDAGKESGGAGGGHVGPEVSTMSEMMRQLSLLGGSMQKMTEDAKLLASSHLQMQTRLENMASESRPSTHSDILTALAAIGTPSLEQPTSLFQGARISKKTVMAAKNREFVVLSDFVPATEPSNTLESTLDSKTGQIVFKSKSAKRTIDNFMMWSTAWCGYESLIMDVDPTMYACCTNYRLFIQRKEALHAWSAVTAYDQRFRVKLSILKLWAFDKVDQEIHLDVFSTETLRPNSKACYRCKSLDHMVKDCFLVEDAPGFKANQGARKKSNFAESSFNNQMSNANVHPPSGVYNASVQVCRDFNYGKCYRNPCTRKHVCSGCGGLDPLFRCYRCQAASPSNSHPTPPAGVGSSSNVSSR